MSDIVQRKDQHLDIVLSGAGRHLRNAGFDAIRFVHEALPDLDADTIDIGTTFLGCSLKAPFLISSMTGGPARAEAINTHLAEAAQSLGVAMAVGSQRAAIEGQGAASGLDKRLRKLAPDVPLLANIGAAQLTRGFGLAEANWALDMIQADALIVHLNPLQEACQAEGDRDWRGVAKALASLVAGLERPVVIKETGAGISAATVRRLVDMGVAAIDVAGAGGANWGLIEGERAIDHGDKAHALAFSDWGLSTVESLVAIRRACPEIPLIGSGGIRSGVDAAKSIRLGADLVGQASGVLSAALISSEAVCAHFEILSRQMRTVCFCTGAADLKTLRKVDLISQIYGTTG